MCAHAFFKGSLANRSCTACHPDSQAAAPGATLRAQCLCRAGFFFELDGDGDVFDAVTGAGCALCPTGTFARFEDPAEYEAPESTCVDCVLGQYADIAGLVACKSCLPFSSSHEYPRVRCH